MEKILELYKYVDGVNDTPFPNEDNHVVITSFRYDAKRMGGAPTISCSFMHHLCLDKLWDYNVYASFNDEMYFIKQIPTSAYDNSDSRYKHEIELVSERAILDNVYVYDVVDSESTQDKPVSNSSNFSFFGDISEFANRLNQSLTYSKVGYRIVVDEGITSEAKMVSFQDQFFSNAIQESYNTYNIPYYFVGKVIHFGYSSNAITRTFKYGSDESLLSIQKQNANYRIVNRITGVGSSDNIPYYYPNDFESKDEVEANGGTWINPCTNLMPPIYRETLGKERFYNAVNDTYLIPNSESYYEFSNPFIEGKPKEHIVNFEDIKPTIKGITNAEGLRIDMFSEFAFDENDNDEFDEEGNYLHPYFFAKLRKFDGEYGFNLFDHAIDEDEMTIAMTSGSCGGCEFIIGVDDENQKNLVQVDENGNLLRDEQGNVRCGREGMQNEEPQDEQNDTINNEVWVALKKDQSSFGVLMPNATNNYRPTAGDTFVILHIDLPKSYILSAEKKLEQSLIKFMSENNDEKFNFSITFSRIFFAENNNILKELNENARIQIEYDEELYELYISSYSYTMSNDKPLPEVRVELSDTLTIAQNALQNAISEVKNDILSNIGNSQDFLKQGLRYFLRKDMDDRSKGLIASDKGFEVGKYVAGASGAIIYEDAETGQTVGEIDRLYIRMKAYFETLEIINTHSVGGKMILSPAGAITCLGVDETEDAYRCYFLGEQDGEVVENRWQVGMQAYSQTFNAKEGVSNKVSNVYYWRLVTGVSKETVEYNNQKCHYIDLSKEDRNYDVNEAGEIIFDSDIPKAGDVINHRGSRTDTDYMNFIEFSSVGTNAPYITLFQGVNSYSLEGKEYVSYGYDQATGRAFMNVYGDMYVGARDGSSFIRYTPETGVEIKARLSVGSTLSDGRDIEEAINNATPEGYQEFVESVNGSLDYLQKQIDGSIDSYYFDYDPTMDNAPANAWTDEEKEAHLGDTFTNSSTGDSWRFGKIEEVYQWIFIEDTATKKALAAAINAIEVADGKRRTFVKTPTLLDAYDVGDLWVNATYGQYSDDLLKCDVAKKSGEAFDIAHWSKASKYTDNSKVEQLTLTVNDLSGKYDTLGVDVESIKQQTDREFTIWFFNYEPTLDNEPASKWNTPELKAEHDQDMFYYRDAGKAWRFEDGKWESITDQDTIRALELIAATRKEVDDMSYLKDALKSAPPTVIENGLVMSSVVAVQNQDGEVEAFINGSNIAEDEEHGKLLLAGGIPENDSDGGTDLAKRSKDAMTRIYEDGHIVSKSADISGNVNIGTLRMKTLRTSTGGDLTGYASAMGVRGGSGVFVLPVVFFEDFIEVKVCWIETSKTATNYTVKAATGGDIIYYLDSSTGLLTSTDSLYIEPNKWYRFTSNVGLWYVSIENILTI